MSAFTPVTRGSNLSQTRFRAGFGFMVDPDKNGTGTKARIYQGWSNNNRMDMTPIILNAALADFTIADGDIVYVHQHYIADFLPG